MRRLFAAHRTPPLVVGAAHYLPQDTVASEELEDKFNLPPGRLFERTGIQTRHIAATATTEDLAVGAAKKALKSAGLTPEDIDILVVGTFTPSTHLPGIASVIAERLGFENCGLTSDENAACASGMFALFNAANHLTLLDAEYALVIATDTATKFVDWESPGGVTPLLGDAAAAVVLAKHGDGIPIRAYATAAASQQNKLITLSVREGKQEYIQMKGRPVFKFMVDEVPSFVRYVVERAGIRVQDIDLLIPHHANGRIIDAIKKDLKKDLGCRVFSHIRECGNTSSAATLGPFADAWQRGDIKRDKITILVSFGAGAVFGCAVLGGP